MAGEAFRFGDYELDVAGHQLRRGGEPVHVEPRALDLLCHLVAHRDRVVPKNELLDEVWGDRFVSEAALTTALRTARLAIGDTGSRQQLIRTVHRRGYQFVAPVTVVGRGPSARTRVAVRPRRRHGTDRRGPPDDPVLPGRRRHPHRLRHRRRRARRCSRRPTG